MKKNGGCPLISACSLIKSNTVYDSQCVDVRCFVYSRRRRQECSDDSANSEPVSLTFLVLRLNIILEIYT